MNIEDDIRQGDIFRLEDLDADDFYDIYSDLHTLKSVGRLCLNDEFMVLELKQVTFASPNNGKTSPATCAQIIAVGQDKMGWILVKFKGIRSWTKHWKKLNNS